MYLCTVRGISGGWAEWTISQPGFGRVEGMPLTILIENQISDYPKACLSFTSYSSNTYVIYYNFDLQLDV